MLRDYYSPAENSKKVVNVNSKTSKQSKQARETVPHHMDEDPKEVAAVDRDPNSTKQSRKESKDPRPANPLDLDKSESLENVDVELQSKMSKGKGKASEKVTASVSQNALLGWPRNSSRRSLSD